MTTKAAVHSGRATPVLSVNVRPVTVAVYLQQGGTEGEGDSASLSGSGLRLSSDSRGQRGTPAKRIESTVNGGVSVNQLQTRDGGEG